MICGFLMSPLNTRVPQGSGLGPIYINSHIILLSLVVSVHWWLLLLAPSLYSSNVWQFKRTLLSMILSFIPLLSKFLESEICSHCLHLPFNSLWLGFFPIIPLILLRFFLKQHSLRPFLFIKQTEEDLPWQQVGEKSSLLLSSLHVDSPLLLLLSKTLSYLKIPVTYSFPALCFCIVPFICLESDLLSSSLSSSTTSQSVFTFIISSHFVPLLAHLPPWIVTFCLHVFLPY